MSNNPELMEMTVLHLLSMEARDTEKEMLELLSLVLKQTNKAALEELNRAKRTPLMTACRYGNMSAARMLVERGADSKVATETGTPVIMAVESGREDILKFLLHEQGASAVQKDLSGVSPLYMACFAHQRDAVDTLWPYYR